MGSKEYARGRHVVARLPHGGDLVEREYDEVTGLPLWRGL